MRKLGVVTLFVAALVAPQAEAIDVAVLGGLGWNAPTYKIDAIELKTSAKTGLGFGATVSFETMPMFSMEAGVFYLNRKFKIADPMGSDQNIEFTSSYLQLPVLVRAWPLPMLSVGLGPYFASGMGKVKSKFGSQPEQEAEYSDAGLKKSDFGVLGSLGIKYSGTPTMALLLDLRYVLGLNNASTESGSFKHRDTQLLAGVSFGF